jgi:hypothetical protein
MENTQATQPEVTEGYLKLLLDKCLPLLLQLATKDQRFRQLILAGMSKEIQMEEAKKGVDKNAVFSLKKIFDAMIEDNKSRELLASACKMNPTTLRLKLFKAREYILDWDEDAEKYRRLDSMVEFQDIRDEKNRALLGMKIVIVRDANAPLFVAKMLEHANADLHKDVHWRNAIVEFIDNGEEGTQLHINNVELTNEDQDMIRGLCDGIPNIKIVSLDKDEFKLNKVEIGI